MKHMADSGDDSRQPDGLLRLSSIADSSTPDAPRGRKNIATPLGSSMYPMFRSSSFWFDSNFLPSSTKD